MTHIAIIGAEPDGLSLVAHLSAAALDVCVFGQAMNIWRRHMPEGMLLKSEGFASNSWHLDGAFIAALLCGTRSSLQGRKASHSAEDIVGIRYGLPEAFRPNAGSPD